jgi:hypothetical protein
VKARSTLKLQFDKKDIELTRKHNVFVFRYDYPNDAYTGDYLEYDVSENQRAIHS